MYKRQAWKRELRAEDCEKEAVVEAFWWFEKLKRHKRSYDDVKELALDTWRQNRTAGLTALAAKATAKIKRWLADTGCGYDLISRSDVHKRHTQKANEDEVITLYTANGPTEVTHKVNLSIGALGESSVMLLDETPAVFSIGRRVMHNGFSFRWDAGKQPYLTDPTGRKIKLCLLYTSDAADE